MICPNLSDPNIRREFDKLTNIVGEDFAYFLWDKNDGLPLSQKLDKRYKKDKVIPNKFYEKLEAQYNGDPVTATLAMSVTYGNNFKKKYPGFDKKTADQKAAIVKKHFESKKDSVEKIANSYISKSSRASRAQREAQTEVIEVTRENLSKDPNSILNNLEDLTGLDRLDAYVKFKESPVSKYINFVNASNIVNSGSYAQWTKNALTVYSGFDYTDLYHESWHEFSQKFLSKEERTELYNTVKRREGKVKIGDLEIPYYALTQKQAEEILAEEYRAYAIARTKNEEDFEKPVATVFQRILNFFKEFFGTIPTNKRLTAEDFKDTKVREMFETLYNNDIQGYSVYRDRPTFDKLNRSVTFQLKYDNEEGSHDYTLGPQESAEVLGFLDYTMYSKMRADGISMAQLMDQEFRDQSVPALYEHAKNSVFVLIDELTSQIESAKSENLKEILSTRRSYLRLLVFSDENWKKIIESHQNSKGGEIFKADLTKADQQDEARDEEDETDQGKSTDTYGDRSSVNPLELYDPYVVELIKSLPDKKIVNGKVELVRGTILGLPLSGNFLANKNLLQDKLQGTETYKEAIEKIQALVEYHPQMQDLIELLPDPNASVLSSVELSLKNQFMQALTMPQLVPYTLKAKAEEEEVRDEDISETSEATQASRKPGKSKKRNKLTLTTFSVSTLTQDAIIQELDQQFQLSVTRSNRSETQSLGERKFANTTNDGLDFATFSVSSALDSYQIVPGISDQAIFEFLNDAFGINLIQNRENLFDKRGRIRQSVSPYSTATLAAIREIAFSAYKKMQLYDLIYNLPNTAKFKGLKNLIPTRIETPAATFLSDIRGDILDRVRSMNTKLADDTNFAPVYQYVTENYKKKPFLNNERVLLFRAVEDFAYVTKSGSFINDEGNLEWSIREFQHLSSEVGKINSTDSINELQGHLNPANNDFVTRSALLGKMFNEQGKRVIGSSRSPLQLRLENFVGYTGDLGGKKTINLDADDKLVQDLASFLKDGIVENMRNGAKSSSFAIRFGESRNDRLYYDTERFEYNPETERIRLNPAVVDQFRKYLEFELSRIYTDANRNDNPTAKQKRGSTFIIFNDILPKEIQKSLIQDLSTSEKSKEETVTALLNTIGYPELEVMLTDFFSEELKIQVQELAEAINGGYIEENPNDKSSIKLEDRFKDAFGNYDMYPTLSSYLLNYYTHQIEYLHLLLGDPSNFNIKPKDLQANNWRELFKRIGSSISPGRQPKLDDQDINTRNSNTRFGRKLEALVNPKNVRNYDRTFNYTQFKDIATFEDDTQKKLYRDNIITNYAEFLKSQDKSKKPMANYLAEAEDLLGDSVNSVLEQNQEADAQAYANLDFARFYLDSIGEWTPQLEKVYQNEVEILKNIIEYRKTGDQKVYNNIKRLQAKVDLGSLPSLKLGFWGSPNAAPNYVMLGKYSVFALLPSAVFETDLEKLTVDMLSKGVDFATFDSGSKMSNPVESTDFYTKQEVTDQTGKTKEVLTISDIPAGNVISLPMEGLRRQQYIAPKFKGEATLSTQLVKLVFSNFYSNGEISEEFKNIPGLEKAIDKAQTSFINSINVIVESEKAKIYSNIGAVLENGKITSYDTQKFANWITREFDKKDIPQSVYDYLMVENNNFVFSLDVSPQRALFESVVASAISKRVIRPKMFGEAFIQLASSGFNKSANRFTKPTKAQVEKYGVSGLRDYGRVVNGKHQPADIKIAFNYKKHSGLLALEYKGEEIGTLSRLNEALLDDEWVEKNSAKITMVGVRIPVQGFNSMEYLRVREFLPESAGPIIIVPPSIVTKSGSDFDIDKLFMYEPELDEEGILKTSSSRFKKDPKLVYNYVNARKVLLEELISLQEVLNNKLEDFKTVYENRPSAVKTMQNFIADNGMILNFESANLTDQEQSELLEKSFDELTLLEKITEASKDDPSVKLIYNNLKSIKSSYAAVKEYSPGNIKSGFSNELIDSISQVLSNPNVVPSMIKPNDSPILKGIAAEYDNKYRRGKGKISSSRMFTPSVSLQIFRENATGKKALGIDAKSNALHKLYQQVGLKYTDTFFQNNFRLKYNQDNGVVLGGYRDANNEHLISDIINEFINGHVDIEKEDWINYFNADKVRTGIIVQMVLNGTPIRDAILLVNQPAVHHFLKNSKLNNTSRMLGFEPKYIGSYLQEGLRAIKKAKFIKRTKKGYFNLEGTIEAMMSDDYFAKHLKNFNEENYPPVVDTSRKSYDDLLAKVDEDNNSSKVAAQLAFLTQYYLVNQQSQRLLALTSSIDFNTSKYRNLNDFHRLDRVLEEAEPFFNKSAIDKILNNSVVSPFNINEDATIMGDLFFDIMGTSWYQDFLNEFIYDYGTYWTADERVTQVNNLNNAIVHGLIQQYSVEVNGVDFYDEYGPQSGYLTKGGVNNLRSKFINLFKERAQDNPELKRFVESNLFLRNFKTKDVDNTNKFYIAMETNEKDPITVDSIQNAFIEGLYFGEEGGYRTSDEELNNEVRKFFEDVAHATIMGQGFSIKYRSIQPYLPLASLGSISPAITKLKELKQTIKVVEGETSEERLKLLEYLDKIKSHYVSTTNARSKSINRKKYFPNYRTDLATQGFLIGSNKAGLQAMLAPNTDSAKALRKKYPITFKGKKYKDALDAYNKTKGPIEKESKISGVNLLVDHMAEILAEKFKQHPRIFGLLYDKGGLEVLDNSYSTGMPGEWSSNVFNRGLYIDSLIKAYNEVLPELEESWLQSKNAPETAEETPPLEDKEYQDYLEAQAVQAEQGEYQSIEDLAADSGMSLKSKPAKKDKEPKKKRLSDQDKFDENLYYGVQTEDGQLIMVNYEQANPENLKNILPNLTEEQLKKVSKAIRQDIENRNPDIDFESTC